ncbi:MAG: aminotransferase class I/II-fold pyridoxal phosphate-dependent enzyme [Phycisphaerales bacterium]|nr:aminotransferase class I/II-fold pyridoxal phosphate-dependent enzyme [Phycisphaerales bacterium]
MPNNPPDSCTASTAEIDGHTVITFGGCNYCALAHHPLVHQAVRDAIPNFGLSTSASRATTGNAAPHQQLEDTLRDFCDHDAALLLPDGYTANLAAFQGLASLGVRHAVLDERAHSSISDAAKLSGMQIHRFEHLDTIDAASVIAKLVGPAVLATDSVFTTDGVLAPVHELSKALRRSDHLLLDDCHGFAVLGDQGRGTPSELAFSSDQLIVTTTLAKGLGCAGGVVVGPSAPVEAAREHSTAYICTTPASPALCAGALKAIEILRTDPHLHDNLRRNTETVRTILRNHHIETHSTSTPIFAFTIGDESDMHDLAGAMLDRGILLPLMHYPNGPAPVYFRLSVTAAHTGTQLQRLDEALTEVLAGAQSL